MKKAILILLFLLAFTGSYQLISSPPPPPPSGKPPCWPPPCIPIDGGITFLIAAGAAYGAKKLYDSRKKSDPV
jgi:hypothetical protein